VTAPTAAQEGLRAPSWERPKIPERLQLVLAAAAVLTVAVLGASAMDPARGALDGLATRGLAPGTASLQSSTCADWSAWSVGRRIAALRTLGVAATGPDPENAGATLGDGAAYSLFQRACSTRVANTFVLYEIYNRAASFAPAAAPASPSLGGFGNGPHS
jgi:hypothetical protein